jgi:hypothetical protein
VYIDHHIKIRIYKTIILSVVMYGCETWPLTLREEHRRRVFENRVLRRIFEPRRNQVTGEWRKLHNEDLHDLHSSPSIIRIMKEKGMRFAGHVARKGKSKVYERFVPHAMSSDENLCSTILFSKNRLGPCCRTSKIPRHSL